MVVYRTMCELVVGIWEAAGGLILHGECDLRLGKLVRALLSHLESTSVLITDRSRVHAILVAHRSARGFV